MYQLPVGADWNRTYIIFKGDEYKDVYITRESFYWKAYELDTEIYDSLSINVDVVNNFKPSIKVKLKDGMNYYIVDIDYFPKKTLAK